jgi:uncharacterized protein (TIGR03437 family)
VNVQLPANIAAGSADVVVTVAGISTSPTLTVAVR